MVSAGSSGPGARRLHFLGWVAFSPCAPAHLSEVVDEDQDHRTEPYHPEDEEDPGHLLDGDLRAIAQRRLIAHLSEARELGPEVLKSRDVGVERQGGVEFVHLGLVLGSERQCKGVDAKGDGLCLHKVIVLARRLALEVMRKDLLVIEPDIHLTSAELVRRK